MSRHEYQYRFSARLSHDAYFRLQRLSMATHRSMSSLIGYILDSIPDELVERIVGERLRPDIWEECDAILTARERRIENRRRALGMVEPPEI